MREFAPAKVNLALHVTGRRSDGLHLLDSLVAFADVGDRLWVEPAGTTSLSISGPEERGVPVDETNSILRAAALAGTSVKVTLDKEIPVAAGIGGGSADAAAVLRAIAALTGRPLPPRPEKLGADVPVCLLARASRMRGIGEVVEPVDLPPLPAVLVNPRRALATALVFRSLRRPELPAIPLLSQPQSVGQTIRMLRDLRNDLEPAATALEPEIGAVLALLSRQPEVRLARMSGSGATCFGLCETREAAVRTALALAAERPGWWVRATVLA